MAACAWSLVAYSTILAQSQLMAQNLGEFSVHVYGGLGLSRLCQVFCSDGEGGDDVPAALYHRRSALSVNHCSTN